MCSHITALGKLVESGVMLREPELGHVHTGNQKSSPWRNSVLRSMVMNKVMSFVLRNQLLAITFKMLNIFLPIWATNKKEPLD